MTANTVPQSGALAARSLVLGGLLPVVAFTLIEEYYGIVAGLCAGMVFGVGEILWEFRTLGKVQPMTWAGNALILVLGGVSLFTNEGIWFKLQPALLEAAMAVLLWGSVAFGRPFLALTMEKALRQQGAELPGGGWTPRAAMLLSAMRGLTLRVGFFFVLHALLATWAALHWSTAAWAMLKGIGFTLSLLVYMVVETLLLRYRFATTNR